MTTNLKKFEPKREQRIAAIRHVVYEYANLMAAAHFSIYGEAPWRTNCDDAFLLGCRKIGDFLLNKKRSKTKSGQELDDVLALDYLPKNATRTWDLPIWKKWRVPMNKQLAHIAYSRDEEWNHRIWLPQFEQEFRKAWRKFRKAIVDDTYTLEFDKQLAVCQAKEGFETVGLGER